MLNLTNDQGNAILFFKKSPFYLTNQQKLKSLKKKKKSLK